MKKELVLILLLTHAFDAFATNGFFAHGTGTKSKGMAGAGVALAEDALGGATNPANLVLLGRRLEIGASLFMPDRGFQADDNAGLPPFLEITPGRYDSKNDFFLIPQFAYNHPLDDKSTIGVVTVMNGLNTEYDAAPFQGNATKPTGADLYQLLIHVPYSRRIHDTLSLGVAPVFGVQAMRFRGFEPFDNSGISIHPGQVTGNGFDFSFGLGLSGGLNYRPNERLSLGLGVQSRVYMTEFDEYQGLLAEEGDFDVPASFQVGAAFRAAPALTLAADYQQIYYSDVNAIGNPNGVLLTPGGLGSGSGLGMGWEDAKVVKIGLRWQYDKDTVLRAGYSHANRVIQGGQGLLNVIAPAVGRDHFSIGLTRQLDKGHEFSVSLTHSPREVVDGTNPNTGPQTGNLRMRQTELEFTYGWKFQALSKVLGAIDMTKAIRVHSPGGPGELKWEEVDVGDPGPGQARVRHTAIGLNFIDVYHRTGLYPVPELPFTPGIEAAGVVEAIGPEVPDTVPEIRVGTRVAYATPPVGAYAEERLVEAGRLVPIPEGIGDKTAAALLLKGMTAQYLLRRTYPVGPEDTILIHAAAGGVGLIVCQWAAHLGARVIGTVGSQEKAELARAHGCHHVIRYEEENFVEKVREFTGGQGVPVVYDSVGRHTFERSLDCLRPRGMLVSFGQSSGPVPPFDVAGLSTRGSLFLTRPTLMDYTKTREELLETARETFEMVQKGVVRVEIRREFALGAASEAHRVLEGRKTVGSTVLVP